MLQHLESKTVAGLTILLAVAVAMNLLGKLTPEMVEILKWLGASFMSVRVAANIGENLPKNPK